MNSIETFSQAKINLTLDVLGKRADGYHEVEMLMQSIALADRIEITKKDFLSISANNPQVPTDATNLVHQAAVSLQKLTGYRGGAHIHIDKNIPIAAGLAGGSSNAAAVLKGLNELWDLGLSFEELTALGASLGADIPFCLLGGTAIARGKGEQLTALEGLSSIDLVLVKPAFSVSTKEVYSRFSLEDVENRPSLERMMEAIDKRDLLGIFNNLGNALESVTLKMHPQIRAIKEKLLTLGARASLMSGSGPTVFAIVDNLQMGEMVAEEMREEGLNVFVTKTT